MEYLLGGKYKILEIIGEGGTSTVFLAEDVKLGTKWAIKKIHRAKEEMPAAEKAILKKLDHPALPRVFDVIEDGSLIYIVEEYIEGITLHKLMEKEGPFSQKQLIKWGIELCNVLQYLHEFQPNPVIYRDLKPSNIMLAKEGSLKLLDFGTAREYKEHGNMDTVFIGTRGYAAPEQYGAGQTCPAADIYSLGVTLYHLATGLAPNEPPFEIQPVTSVSEKFSYDFEKIIKKCTRLDPSKRYRDAADLKTELENIAGGSTEDSCSPLTQKRKRTRGFKRLVLAVWDNTEFACELAYICAKVTEYKILLADLDLLSPKADLYLNVRKYPQTGRHKGLFKRSGLNIIMDTIEKGLQDSLSIEEACVKRRELKNLHILTGSYSLEDYEYYSDKALLKFIELAYRNFDISILAVSRSIYDLYSFISLARSDYNIAAVPARIDVLREINNYLFFLQNKQRITADKTKFVAYDYIESLHLSTAALQDVTDDNFIGFIRANDRKTRCRNLKKPYVTRINRDLFKDYKRILKYFDILQNDPLREKGIKGIWDPSVQKKYPLAGFRNKLAGE